MSLAIKNILDHYPKKLNYGLHIQTLKKERDKKGKIYTFLKLTKRLFQRLP
jgi:hypothetical protein